jgi:hypothetical protein
MEYVYNGAAEQVHAELGLLEPGKTYEVTADQAKWLSPDAGWEPKSKRRGGKSDSADEED